MTTMTVSPNRPLLRPTPIQRSVTLSRRTGALLLAGVTAVAATVALNSAGPADVTNALASSGALADQVSSAQLDSAGLSASAGTAQVKLPSSAGDAITLTSSQGVLKVGLPITDAAASGTRAGTGTLVYQDKAMNLDVAAQIVADGARALVVLNSSQSPQSFTFPLSLPAGVSAVEDGEGGFDLVRAGGPAGAAGFSVGSIAAPWAKDATGQAVPTRYSLNGSELVQTVQPGSNVQYPIVADPRYTWGYVSGTVYYNRSETRNMKTASAAATAAAGICAFFGAETAGAACVLSAAVYGQWLYVAGNAYGDGKCLKIKAPPFWGSAYKNSYCK
jgi:hypothetical protein